MAAQAGCSLGVLAKHAGLDPTAFNPSRRTSPTGLPRWPTSGTLAAVMIATGTSWSEFGVYVDQMAKVYVAPKGKRVRRAA